VLTTGHVEAMALSDAEAGPTSSWITPSVWLAGGLVTAFINFWGAVFTAADIAEVPQPDQEFWITVVRAFAVLPVAGALFAAAVCLVARAPRRIAVLAAAHVLLWPSLGLIFVWIPKAP
jgi:hypothetical protein